MNKVYVCQQLIRYHCPKCDGTYSTFDRETNTQTCKKCGHEYDSREGVPKPVHSLTEAAVYGDIEVLYNHNKVGIALQPIATQIRHALRNFDDGDYLLPVGDPVLIGVCTYYAAKANNGRVKLLRWDRQTRSYIKIEAQL